VSTITEILALAETHTAANRMLDAEQLFRQAIQLDASCATAHHNLGVTLVHQGRVDEAARCLAEAQRLAPDSQAIGDSLRQVRAILANQRGAELAAAGQFDEAAESQAAAIELNPHMAQAHCDLGLARLKQNRLGEAAAALARAIELEPQRADTHNHLGVVLARQAKLSEAAARHRQSIALDPKYAEAHYNLGVVLAAMGQWREAATHYRQATALQPEFASAHNNLGIALGQEGRIDAAAESYRRALAINPAFAEASNNLGVVLMRQGELDEAEAQFRRAIALKDRYAEARHNLGNCLVMQERYEEATDTFRDAIDIRGDHADSHHNLAYALIAQNRVEESLAASARAVELRPQYAEAHFNRAAALLALGQFAEGWREFEWRLARLQCHRADLPQKHWQGEPLDGRTILISSERGIDDTIQFLRYAPLLHERGGRVVVECPQPLARLAETCAGVAQVVSTGETLPPFDVHVPVASLPGVMETSLQDIPNRVPYFQPDAVALARWRDELAARDGLKVGIAWQADLDDARSHDGSIPPGEIARLAQVSGVQWVSLQRDAGSDRLATLFDPARCIAPGDRLVDFLEMAAVVRNLDLVIACDSSVAHLAGALGVPTWTALPWAADWRWMLDRADCPWYPTMRLFRQSRRGDWSSVLDRIAQELTKLAGESRRSAVQIEPPPAAQETREHVDRAPSAGPTPATLEVLRRAQASEATELALQLASEGKPAESAVHFRRALEIDPNHAAARGNLGNLLMAEGDLDGAKACYQAVLELDPRSVEAHYSMGVVSNERAQFAEAEHWCQQALEIQEDYGDAHYVLGTARLRQNRLTEAAAAFRRAIELKPELVGPHLGLAFSLLAAGKTAEGWREYEWRSKNQSLADDAERLSRWQGESLADKTLLVRAEQGFGDALQFIRYAQELKQRGARVVVQCRPPLARLLATTPGVDSVTVAGEALPPVDLQVPLLSVPGILGTTFDNVPASVPYLKPSRALAARAGRALHHARQLRVGIAWQGDPTQPMDRFRSIPLSSFAAITRVDGVRVYSLQFGPGREQLDDFVARNMVEDLGDQLGDFHDTGAFVEQLDLVITCDSALAHLAGGLGVPVWVALAHTCDWRWMLERVDSPWYPSMRLFRQSRLGDWTSVFSDVARELTALASAARRPKSNIDQPTFLD
jgi:tetratricopeptide (TPR) repeat protein